MRLLKKRFVALIILCVLMLASVRVDVYADPTYDYYLYVDATGGDLKVNSSGNIVRGTTEVSGADLDAYMYTSEQSSPTNKFQTLYAACKTAPADKKTKIVMLSDILIGGDGITSAPVSSIKDNQYKVLADNNKEITLDLNGKTLDGNDVYSSQLKASHGGVLTIEGTGTVKRFGWSTGICAENQSKIILKGNCSIIDSGRVCLMDQSEFEMQAGTINNCVYQNQYSPVYITGGGKFTMSGGTITNCSSDTNGGAVYVKNGSNFTMTGGTISNCTASDGGAVYVDNGGTCDIAGTVSNCTATDHGDAVYVNNGGNSNITGTITGCGTDINGGVYICDNITNQSNNATGSISSFDGNDSVIEAIDYAASHKLTAEISGIATLTAEQLNYLKTKPEVTFILNYSYEGIDYRIEIPGTAAVVEPDIYYYGPLKLYEMYGPNGTVKATVDSEYVVRSGDTLSKIAAKFGMKVKKLLELNPHIQNPNKIYVGKTLRIK